MGTELFTAGLAGSELKRYQTFMRLGGSGREIGKFLADRKCTPGVVWGGVPKGRLARIYAVRISHNKRQGITIDEAVFTQLKQYFGLRSPA